VLRMVPGGLRSFITSSKLDSSTAAALSVNPDIAALPVLSRRQATPSRASAVSSGAVGISPSGKNISTGSVHPAHGLTISGRAFMQEKAETHATCCADILPMFPRHTKYSWQSAFLQGQFVIDIPARRSMWMLIQAGTMYCSRPARMTMPRPLNMSAGYSGAAAKKASHWPLARVTSFLRCNLAAQLLHGESNTVAQTRQITVLAVSRMRCTLLLLGHVCAGIMTYQRRCLHLRIRSPCFTKSNLLLRSPGKSIVCGPAASTAALKLCHSEEASLCSRSRSRCSASRRAPSSAQSRSAGCCSCCCCSCTGRTIQSASVNRICEYRGRCRSDCRRI